MSEQMLDIAKIRSEIRRDLEMMVMNAAKLGARSER